MYIQYTMDQLCLPMDLEEDMPKSQLVRVVNSAVNWLDDVIFDAASPDGGRDSYHPKMLTKVLQFLADEKYKSLEHYFVDGTKIEANANRYTFVWGKARNRRVCSDN